MMNAVLCVSSLLLRHDDLHHRHATPCKMMLGMGKSSLRQSPFSFALVNAMLMQDR